MTKAIDPKLEKAIQESGQGVFLAATLVVDQVPRVKQTTVLLQLLKQVENLCGQLPNRAVFFSELGMMAVTGTASLIKTFIEQKEVIAAEVISEGGVPSDKDLADLAARYRRRPVLGRLLLGVTALSAVLLIASVVLVIALSRSNGQIKDQGKELENLQDQVTISKSSAYAMLSLPDPLEPAGMDFDQRDRNAINRDLEELAGRIGSPPRVVAYELALSSYRLRSNGILVRPTDLLPGIVSRLKPESAEKFLHRLELYEKARLAKKTHKEAMDLMFEAPPKAKT